MSAAALVLSLEGRDDAARLLASLEGELQAGDVVSVCGPQEALADRTYARLDVDGVAAWNAVAAAHPAHDLVIVGPSTEFAPRTLSGLRAVAAAEPDAATITPLGSSAQFLSAPNRNVPNALPAGGRTVAAAAEAIGAQALAIHPRIPTALPHCTRVARAALQLIGPFDETLAPRDALADFCARATAAGLVHVAADELFVGVRMEAEPATEWIGPSADRHPSLAAAVYEAATDRHSALSRALLAVSVTLEPLSVTLDVRGVTGASGTGTHVLGLVEALSARPDLRVRALIADGAPVPGVELVLASAAETAGRTHVVHRPWQPESLQDLEFLDLLGERMVITNQDLIAYRTPSVFPDVQAWQEYRDVTRGGLGRASAVLFFTQAAAEDAQAEDLVTRERSFVTGLGVEDQAPAAGVCPDRLAGDERPFLLALGARFRHKNLRFAIELTAALRERHGWDGRLVLAGREVLHGSGSGDAAAWLLEHPEAADTVVDLGAVSEEEKRWLFANAAAVVAPSTYEGFGLVPFESAASGTPCLVAPVSAMRETLPPELALLVPWDAGASADAAIAVLGAGADRDAFVARMRAAGGIWTWDAVVDAHVAAYRQALLLPAPAAVRLAEQLARAERDYWSVRGGLDDRQFALVRADDPLLDERLVEGLHHTLSAPDRRRRFTRALRLVRALNRR